MDDGDRDAGVHGGEPKQGVRPHLDVVDASSEGERTDFAGAAELDAYLGGKLSRCEVVLEEPADIAQAWAFVTCSYQTSNSRTVVYAKEVKRWDSRPSE